MPLDSRRGLLLVHIPKTAGSSLEHALFGLDTLGPDSQRSREDRLFGLIPPLAKLRYGLLGEREWQHLKAFQLRRVLGRKAFDACFKFAVVRNPWDRLVSWYHYLRVPGPFGEWLPHLERGFRHASGARLTANQCDWIGEPGTDRLLVDRVLRFERLTDDLKALLTPLGLPPVELPAIRRSVRRPYPEYYDARSRDLVARLFDRDIRTFGYEFGS